MHDSNNQERRDVNMGNFDFYKVLAVVAVLAAQFGAGSASLAGCCQPKEPNNIDVVLNKHN